MKFRLLILFYFTLSCAPQLTTYNKNESYSGKGFAYIYNDSDFKNKIIKGRMNNNILQISHQNLKIGTLIKILNPKNNKNIVIKNTKRIRYPDFYKILITDAVVDELELNKDVPILEITEIKKNKSFIAKKAKIYNEERKISSKAPVASVQISNISKNKSQVLKNKDELFYILVGTFYSENTAKFLRERIIKDVLDIDHKKLKTKKINNKETQVISGPYTSINSLKNDYIKIKSFGFEELDIFINE